jgi:hypothetical protein
LISPFPKTVYVVMYADGVEVGRVPVTLIATALSATGSTVTPVT